MKKRRIFLTLLFLVTCACCVWWYFWIRIPLTLATGQLENGQRYRIIQEYKDFCESGWVVGIYVSETGSPWKLRWSGHEKLPWRKTKVSKKTSGFNITLETDVKKCVVNDSILSEEIYQEFSGGLIHYGASFAEMRSGLIDTTY